MTRMAAKLRLTNTSTLPARNCDAGRCDWIEFLSFAPVATVCDWIEFGKESDLTEVGYRWGQSQEASVAPCVFLGKGQVIGRKQEDSGSLDAERWPNTQQERSSVGGGTGKQWRQVARRRAFGDLYVWIYTSARPIASDAIWPGRGSRAGTNRSTAQAELDLIGAAVRVSDSAQALAEASCTRLRPGG